MSDIEVIYEEFRVSPKYAPSMAYTCTVAEAKLLRAFAESLNPEIILECGTAVGWSSMWLALGSTCEVHTFDIIAREPLFNHPRVIKHMGEYAELLHGVMDGNEAKRKLFFIDGDHRRSAITRDYEATAKYLIPGDMLVFHDIYSEGGSARFDCSVQNWHPEWERKTYRSKNGLVTYTVKS